MSTVWNSGGRSSRRRMLKMVGAAAAIPAISGLGAHAAAVAPRRAVAHRPPDEAVAPMKMYTVPGGGGLGLHVREWGKANGPAIVFIHGWSQNHLSWAKQYEGSLADEFRLVAFDLRGHGMSEAPLEPGHYTDERLWADDVAAIIDQLGLDPAGARRLVLRRVRHLRLPARPWPGSDRGDQLRRWRFPTRPSGVGHDDRPGISRPLRRRHRRRPSDEHSGHALLRAGMCRQAGG